MKQRRRWTTYGLSFWLVAVSVVSRAQTIPSAPTNLQVSAVSAIQINLSWTDTSTNEDGFKVERSLDGTNFLQIAQLLPTTTVYRNTSLFPVTTYFYRVRAYNAGGNSGFSNVAGAQTLGLCSPSVGVVTWGDNFYGEAGPSGLTGVVAVAAGVFFDLALQTDGTVVGWGNNGNGQTTPPEGLTNVVAISAGNSHSLALQSNGTVVGWGNNGNGQATPPAGLTNAVAISAGDYFSLALKGDGTIVGWGYDGDGEVSVGETLTGVVAISTGNGCGLALRSDGTVVGWGANSFGQVSPPAGLTGIVAIALGPAHALAVHSDGTVIGWGYNGEEELNPPAGLTGVVAVACSEYASFALKSDGSVVVWGSTYYNYSFSTPPAGLAGVLNMATGPSHGLAVGVVVSGPTGLVATAVSSNEVDLAWASTGFPDGFNIQRAPDNGAYGGGPGAWTQIATVGSTVTNYTDTGLTSDVTYWYQVQAFDSCGVSGFSAPASATPPSAPIAPSELTATGVFESEI